MVTEGKNDCCRYRPQRFSNVVPALYGFITRTLTGTEAALLCMDRTGLRGIRGDGDAMDICILTKKDICALCKTVRYHLI